MTEKLKEKTHIPNWAMAVFLAALITFFTAGWVKVDNLESEVIKNKEHLRFRTEQMIKIDKKLDEILVRIRHLENKK